MTTTSGIRALGIDVGSATAKVVGVDGQGELVWSALEPTLPRMEDQAAALLQRAREEANGGRPSPVAATGYGRKLVRGADRVVTEITCHARGVHRRTGLVGTLIDVGGQDSKVIRLGEGGRVLDFAMNDKCAAGTGRFLEVTASRLQIPVERMGPLALEGDEEVAISSTCTVFAESEIISLLAQGEPLERIIRGLHRSLVSRLLALARGVRPEPPFALSGGVALNPAVHRFLSQALGAEIEIPAQPQLMGAYGAALSALAGVDGSPSGSPDQSR
jgi:predicted CoA-substrate-specific enzyme activase